MAENKLQTINDKLGLQTTEIENFVQPLYERFKELYPDTTNIDTYRIGMNFAKALSEVKVPVPNQTVLQYFDKSSISEVFDTVCRWGLDLSCKQAIIVPRKNVLTLQYEYFGWVKIVKTIYPNAEITANVVYEGEKFSIERRPNGKFKFNHEPNANARIRGVIVGAYFECFVKTPGKRVKKTTYPDGRITETTTETYNYECIGTEYMTMAEIRASWNQSANGPKVHNAFPHEMAKKTVINRGCKHIVNTYSAFTSLSSLSSVASNWNDEDEVAEEKAPIIEYNYVVETPENYSEKTEENTSEKIVKQPEEKIVETTPTSTDYHVENGMAYYPGCEMKQEIPTDNEPVQEPINDDYFEISYREYADHKNEYEPDRNCNIPGYSKSGYNASTKMIRVKKLTK